MNYFTENISFNISKKMKLELDNLGLRTEKKMSELLRELIISGMNNYQMKEGFYEKRKSSSKYCFD